MSSWPEIHRQLVDRASMLRAGGIAIASGYAGDWQILEASSSHSGRRRLSEQGTILDLASLSKVITADIYARMLTERNGLNWDTTIGDIESEMFSHPALSGIRIKDLALHTSGLPRMPLNFRPKETLNPYKDYSWDDLISSFKDLVIDRRKTGKFQYSNYGYGILGVVLSEYKSKALNDIIQTYITRPLSLNILSSNQELAFNSNHGENFNRFGQPVPSFINQTLAACGGLRATFSDLIALANSFSLRHGRVARINRIAQFTYVRESAHFSSGFSWRRIHSRSTKLIFSDGFQFGCYCFIGMNIRNERAFVLYSNVGISQREFALGVLEPNIRTSQDVVHIFENYRSFVGSYMISSNESVSIQLAANVILLEYKGKKYRLKHWFGSTFESETGDLDLELMFGKGGSPSHICIFTGVKKTYGIRENS